MTGRKKVPAEPTHRGFGPEMGRAGYNTGTTSVAVPPHGAAGQPGTASVTVEGTPGYTALHLTLMHVVPAPAMIVPPVTVQL